MTTSTTPEGGTGTLLGVQHTPVAFDMPKGACDCHVHVFGPVERFPFAPERFYTPGRAWAEDLMVHQRLLELDRVVVVQASPYGFDNACTLAAVATLGDRARAVAVIAPEADDATLAAMDRAGVRGLRVNLSSRGEDNVEAAEAALTAAARTAARFGWHVQIFTSLTVLAGLDRVIRYLPTPLVVDHFGRASAKAVLQRDPDFLGLLDLVASGNVYVKLSAPHRSAEREDASDMEQVARAFVNANPDRLLWGSDWPHPSGKPGAVRPGITPYRPVDDGRALNRLQQWIGRADVLNKILVDNPARLYGFAALPAE